MTVITKELLDPFIACCVGRRNDCALQCENGGYARLGQPLGYDAIFAHLQGQVTLGTYVIHEEGGCSFVVFDSDTVDGLVDLARLQSQLASLGVHSYLEQSRRGGHLWVFVDGSVPPVHLRSWLLPYCPAGVEFYPKQDSLDAGRPYGSLIRLPLGVHQLTGQRYPFVSLVDGAVVPLVTSVVDALSWFATVVRNPVAVLSACAPAVTEQPPPLKRNILPAGVGGTLPTSARTICNWCSLQDPLSVIGRYVALDANGMGRCPFGSHHAGGVDVHPSFRVYLPSFPDICCWYCHTWQQGGSLFDFLRLYYNLDARDLWHRILDGAQF